MTKRTKKTELKRVAEENTYSKRWRIAVYYTDGSMRRLPGTYKSKEAALEQRN